MLNELPDLKRLRKRKGLKGLPGLGRKARTLPLPVLGQQPTRVAVLTDERLARLTNQLGEQALAKRVLALQQKWPLGTVPELIVMDFLERRHFSYEFQFWVFGGRARKGGAVLDFVIDVGTGVIAVWVNGNYWHGRAGRSEVDHAQRLAVMGIRIWGKRVSATVSIWESRIATNNKFKREQALNAMIQGKELGV